MTETVFAVVVTHRRPDELAKSLDVLSTQTRLPDHLIVVDNDFLGDGAGSSRVRDLVAAQPISTTYLGSSRNLGGAGGFALGMLHALAQGADWVWLADDDGRPQDSRVLATLLGHTTLHGGRISLHGKDVSALPTYRRVTSGLGYVPQEREIFPSLTVRENLEVAARPGPWNITTVFELFPRLEERRHHRGNELSGG